MAKSSGFLGRLLESGPTSLAQFKFPPSLSSALKISLGTGITTSLSVVFSLLTSIFCGAGCWASAPTAGSSRRDAAKDRAGTDISRNRVIIITIFTLDLWGTVESIKTIPPLNRQPRLSRPLRCFVLACPVLSPYDRFFLVYRTDIA